MLNEETILGINTGQPARLEVLFQDEVQLDIDVPLFYIKSGEEEIKQYVDGVTKPEIDVYVGDKKAVITVAADEGVEAVNKAAENAERILDNYVEEVNKPEITSYVETTVKPELQSYADELREAFDANAAEKTAAVNTLAEQAEASAQAAAASASAAQTAAGTANEKAMAAAGSATAASSSADTAELWAVGSIEEQPEGSAKYWAEKVNPGKLFPIGMIAAWPGNTPPDGWLVCNGATISRTTYADLFAAIGTTFGSGDGSTTFHLPDFQGDFLRGYLSGTTAAIGARQAEGLPNITGHAEFGQGAEGSRASPFRSAEGAFYPEKSSKYAMQDSTIVLSGLYQYLQLNASRSSSVYGKSSHVTPVNQAVSWCIKY